MAYQKGVSMYVSAHHVGLRVMDKPAVIHLCSKEPDWILFICFPPSIFAWTTIKHSSNLLFCCQSTDGPCLPVYLQPIPLQRGGLEAHHQDLCFLGGHLLLQSTTQSYRTHGSPNNVLDLLLSPVEAASHYLSRS